MLNTLEDANALKSLDFQRKAMSIIGWTCKIILAGFSLPHSFSIAEIGLPKGEIWRWLAFFSIIVPEVSFLFGLKLKLLSFTDPQRWVAWFLWFLSIVTLVANIGISTALETGDITAGSWLRYYVFIGFPATLVICTTLWAVWLALSPRVEQLNRQSQATTMLQQKFADMQVQQMQSAEVQQALEARARVQAMMLARETTGVSMSLPEPAVAAHAPASYYSYQPPQAATAPQSQRPYYAPVYQPAMQQQPYQQSFQPSYYPETTQPTTQYYQQPSYGSHPPQPVELVGGGGNQVQHYQPPSPVIAASPESEAGNGSQGFFLQESRLASQIQLTSSATKPTKKLK